MKLIIVAAISLNNVIGFKNKIPWHNNAELNYFKNLTINNAVLMGRLTFESIGKPLSKRLNIVLSRSNTKNIDNKNPFYFNSINEAVSFAEHLDVKKLFVIGGSQIYEKMINKVDELIISRIPFEVLGDKYFPKIDLKYWKLDKIEEYPTFSVEKYIKNEAY